MAVDDPTEDHKGAPFDGGPPLPGEEGGLPWRTTAAAEAALSAKLDEVIERLERILALLPAGGRS